MDLPIHFGRFYLNISELPKKNLGMVEAVFLLNPRTAYTVYVILFVGADCQRADWSIRVPSQARTFVV